MADLVDDIKSRLSVYDVVSQYLPLKKAGRSWKALSPFQNEKTPSFYVSPEKNIWHCFSSGKGGDIFSFVQEYEGVDFAEALNILSEKAGLKLEDYRKDFKPEKKTEKEEMYKAHDLAVEFFQEKLHGTNDGKKVKKYLEARGVSENSMREFSLGFAPDSFDSLYPYLMKKGISKSVLLKCGFVSSKSVSAENIYDKFRSRLMFPIFDCSGRICGFGGRALKREQMPKYLNSPENLIYSKSRIVYGFSHAKQAIKQNDKVLLVEGYFDVILPYQEGIKFVVASSGTSLTRDHVKLIKRFTSNVILCFDSDEAGFNATIRSYELLREEMMNVSTVAEISGKDPADFVIADKAGFLEKVEKAVDFLDFYIDKLLQKKDISDVLERSDVFRSLMPYFQRLSPIERDFYIRSLSLKFGVGEQIIYDELSTFSLPKTHPSKALSNMSAPEKISRKLGEEEILVSMLLEYPFLFKETVSKLSENDFSDYFKCIYREMNYQYNLNRENFEGWCFDDEDFSDKKEKMNVLMLYGEQYYGVYSRTILEEELQKLILRFNKKRKQVKLEEIQKQIAVAEEKGDKELMISLLQRQQELLSNN